MKTYFKLTCPGCKESLPIRAEYFGKRVACKRCKHVFTPQPQHVVRERPAAAAASPQAAPAAAPDRAAVQETAQTEIGRLNDQLHALRREADEQAGRARQEAEARQQELADARAEAEWLRTLVAELQEGERKAAEKWGRLRAELAETQAEYTRLSGELVALREERAQLIERPDHSGTVEALEAELGQARQELAARTDERDNACREVARLEEQLPVSRQEAERNRGLVAELGQRLTQVSEETEAKLQTALTENSRLREELSAVQEAQHNLAGQFAAVRGERDRLLEQRGQAPAIAHPVHEWDGEVLQAALQGVSTRVGWPWFDNNPPPARKPEQPPAKPANEEPTPAMQQERTNLQNEIAKLRKENGVLRQYLENFGVQLIEV